MPLPKPIVPRWCDTGTRTEPTEGRKDSGWLTGDFPPAQELNWIDGHQSDWLKYLAERMADGLSTPPEREFVLKNPFTTVAQLRTLETQGMGVDIGLNVGFYAASADADAVHIGDADFGLRGSDADVKKLVFDDDDDSFRLVRSAHRFEWLANGSQRAALSEIGLRIGAGAPTIPFHLTQDIGGMLGTALGDYLDIESLDYMNGDTVSMLTYGYRHSAGSDWTTASTYAHNHVLAGDPKGFVRFSGSAVASSAYGIGTHVGIGVGGQGSDVAMWVDDANVYARKLLPYAARLGSLGTYARPWGDLWLCDDLTQKNGYIRTARYAGSGGSTLNLETYIGLTLVGSVQVYGETGYSKLECTGVSFVRGWGYYGRYGGPSIGNRGFAFENDLGSPDATGMFYELDPSALRLWKRNRRMVDIASRTGNVDDVQLTLGRGSGAGGLLADLREYACVCQDYLSQAAIVLGDIVRISTAADHAVTLPATTPAETGIVGVCVETSMPSNTIGRIATSGIVLARTDGIVAGVTRGQYCQHSITIPGRVRALATFGPEMVGVALQTVGANSYFKMLIRFGG